MSIDTKATFCHAVNTIGAENIKSFHEVLNLASLEALRVDPDTTKAALANASGAWYAWLLVIFGESINSKNPDKTLTFLKLPNVTSMPCSALYENSLQLLLNDFQKKLSDFADVNLVTSNPDFAILNLPQESRIYDLKTALNNNHLEGYDRLYRDFESRCKLENLIAYIGVKTSLRPDRRIQLLHEGSLMKAIYTHLKTRNWDLSANGLAYHALTLSELSDADTNGLKSVATHSIVSASLKPERAVDSSCQIASVTDLEIFFKTNF